MTDEHSAIKFRYLKTASDADSEPWRQGADNERLEVDTLMVIDDGEEVVAAPAPWPGTVALQIGQLHVIASLPVAIALSESLAALRIERLTGAASEALGEPDAAEDSGE